MSKKRWFITNFRENVAFKEKLFPTVVRPTNYTGYVKFAVYLEIKLKASSPNWLI
jgi:hypothetical protein